MVGTSMERAVKLIESGLSVVRGVRISFGAGKPQAFVAAGTVS